MKHSMIVYVLILSTLIIGNKADACDRGVTLTGDGGTVTSHAGFPTIDYENNLDCSWHITVPTGWGIQLKFDYFNVDWADAVSIYNGSSSADSLLRSFDEYSSIPLPVLTASSNNLLVKFTTNSYSTDTGFRFNWFALPECDQEVCLKGGSCYILHKDNLTCGCPVGFAGHMCEAEEACDGGMTVTGDGGTVTSHAGARTITYENNLNCSWHITVPTGWGIQLEFDFFHVVREDAVSIYNGSSSAELMLRSFNGYSITPLPVLTSLSNNLLVKFTTDSFGESRGFRFNWVALPECDQQVCMNNGSCHILQNNNAKCACPLGFAGDLCEADVLCGDRDVVSGYGGTVVSHQLYGLADYENYLDCGVLISAPEKWGIQLKVDYFNLFNYFGKDAVSIYNGSSSADSLLGSFSEYSSIPLPVLTASSNNLLVKFTTDSYYTDRGFRFKWVALPECDQQVCMNGGSCYILQNDNLTCGCPVGFAGHMCKAEDACDGGMTVTGDGGSVTSHAGAGFIDYKKNLDCSWHITVPTGWGIQLKFDFFSLDWEDALSIYNGSSSADLILGSFDDSSSTPLPVLTSLSNNLLVKFTTNSEKGSGFMFNWVALPECHQQVCMNNGSCHILQNKNSKCACPLGFAGDLCETDVLCGGRDVLSGYGGTVVSHQWYGLADYDIVLDCGVLISAPEQWGIHLEFDDFTTEKRHDVMSIYNGSSSADSLMVSFSGSITPPPVFTSSSNNMFVRFKTNHYQTAAGFRFRWSKTAVTPTTVAPGTTTSTPGSSTVTTAPSEVVDACSVDRGGCDQYCMSSGPNLTCVCSDSFVLSSVDNKICDDPCEKDNGGCHQLCSVSNHQVVCACYDGYTINPDDGTLCIEKDECLAVNCTNGGTCVDLINRFFCDCVDGWIGETCDQKAKADPVLISMHQDKGPVAGGTRITLRGRDFIKGALLTLGEGIQCSFNIQESNSTVAILTTPVVRTEEANKALSVTVRFPGYEALNTDFTFTYKANPTLQSVYPLKANIIGGTSFTVNGEALDIVSDSRIEITMVHKYTEIGITKTNSTLYNSTCEVKGSTSMNCLAPKVDIPPSLRTVEEETDQTIMTERETLDFFLGFRLDGVTTYTNLSDTKELFDYRKISYLTEEPEVLQSSFSPFVPNSGATISIKGSGFLQGFEPSDYRVAIGSGWCRDVDVTDNEIICTPPDILSGINSKRKKRGTDTDSDYIYRDGERPKRAAREVVVDVLIHAGANLHIKAGTITYLINDTTAKKPNGASISAGFTMTTVLGVLAGWMLA